MVKIAYPDHDFRIKEEDGKEYIFDALRKKWVRLTPEEWVRQNMLQYLLQVMQYPASLIGVEVGIQLNGMTRRCDIVVWKDDKPWMIIECKEMDVPLSPDVLMQVLRYNMSMPSAYLLLTNGRHVYGWQLADGQATEIAALPAW